MQSDGHQFFLRAHWFWQQLCAKKYPNTSRLMEKFEISRPTAERLIELLKNDYHAPLSYDEQLRGYQLDDPDWQLPFLPISTDELLAIALARQHLRQASEGFLSGLLETYWDRLIKELEEKIPKEVLDDSLYSVADPRVAPVVDKTLQTILKALVEKKRVKVGYRSPWSDDFKEREISPWHLRFAEGRLYLWAYCHLRQEPRLFQVLGIESPRLVKGIFYGRPTDFVQTYLQSGMGKFFTEKPFEIKVQVFPPRSRYVAKERWHPDQRDQLLQDDSLERSFLATSIREVAWHLLYLGDAVEVLSPKELREEMARQARAILKNHAK